MKVSANALPLLLLVGTGATYAQISKFDHIIIVVQENRTPDNLFQGLCSPQTGLVPNCSATPAAGQYNIQTSNWLDNAAPGGVIQPGLVPLANNYDLDHSHPGFSKMCDTKTPPAGLCQMGGVNDVRQFNYVDNSTGILNPYLDLAKQYGWANYMFQTNQGPSFPAHQFLFGGTSAPTPADDPAGIFASENILGSDVSGLGKVAGCIAPAKAQVQLIRPPGIETKGDTVYPCFEHNTLPDLLPSTFTWRYYSPSPGSIWTAPDAIKHICEPVKGKCTGPEWTANVDATNPSDVLQDILNCNLRSVSWVIPTGQNSDHANVNDGGGPSWVAAIVNAIGESTSCDANTGYWNNTAIVITWDDWGGWYDHEAPPTLTQPEGDYQYGFRVPLIVVSAYTPTFISNTKYFDFGSILRFTESNFGLPLGALTFADARAKTDLHEFFNLKGTARPFKHIVAPLDAKFFLNDKRVAADPDDDQ
jgi:phospholipase C